MGNRGRILAKARRNAGLAALCAAAVGLTASPASAAQEPVEVEAAGNPFLGGLTFVPETAAARVGQRVRWTNTDIAVPHTATEVNGLWDLAGDYGATPVNPSGFGPGESVERRFAAGTFDYFCRVHGTVQSGRIDVPMAITERRRKGKRPIKLSARWSRTELPEGQVFDVQRKNRDGGRWRKVRDDTRSLRLTARARPGKRLAFRARVQQAGDPSAASRWSPVARVKTG